MKIQLLSDLHLEFGQLALPDSQADLVILAGDVAIQHHGLRWIQKYFASIPVLYVLGNHEYYGHRYPLLLDELRKQFADSNIHLLEDDVFHYQRVNFFGATLWTDFNLHGTREHSQETCQQRMNDYRKIGFYPSFGPITPSQVLRIHNRSRAALKQFLTAHQSQTNVVISHHAPSLRSIPSTYKTSELSPAYASHLDALIEQYNPTLWCHGHIHESVDYRIGHCRVISNPRGYANVDPNPQFNPSYLLELDPT